MPEPSKVCGMSTAPVILSIAVMYVPAPSRHVYITVPLVEVDRTPVPGSSDGPPEVQRGGPRLFNTVCLVSPQGKLVAHYRKLTPWPHPEKSWATPGDRGVQVYDTEYGRVGLAICYDIHTILEKYRPKKIWALLYPIAWVDGVVATAIGPSHVRAFVDDASVLLDETVNTV